MRLILASASPRRAELLTAAGFSFEVCATDVDERVRADERAREYVTRLAVDKSACAWTMVAGGMGDSNIVVLGADTAVIVDEGILGKPVDDADAERMLRRISGRAHTVMTGVSVRTAECQLDALAETVVHVRSLTATELAWYVASGEGRDKAGGYAIQGLASRFIPRIDGSYSNVVGLPVALVAELFEKVRSSAGIPRF
jgi:septum formation protein